MAAQGLLTRGINASVLSKSVPAKDFSRYICVRRVRTSVLGGGGSPLLGQEPGPEDVNYDPESLFKGVPVQSGIIERRMMQRQIETDQEFAKAMKGALDEDQQKEILRRESRKAPENDDELIEYFLNTDANDLEYEVFKYRPRMTKDFFRHLDKILGNERFASLQPDEDRINELDMLRKYLGEAAEAVDRCIESTSSAVERMKKLLSAKDKKEMILEMAGKNEIDLALINLLDQNIEQARGASQEPAAQFMEKVKNAAAKYLV